MWQQILQKVLWLAPIALQAVIITAMWVRGLYKQLPYFFAYTAFVVANSTVLLPLYRYKIIYFYSSWAGELVSWILGIAVIYEIYASLLKEYTTLEKLGTWIFRIVCMVLAIAALWTAFSVPSSDTMIFSQRALTLERSVRIVQCGLLVALFLFASFFGLSWKNYLFGVALGFAIFVCVELAIVGIRAYFGPTRNQFYVWLKSGSYNLGVLVWTFYMIKAPRMANLRTMPKTQLAEWNETLQELLHR